MGIAEPRDDLRRTDRRILAACGSRSSATTRGRSRRCVPSPRRTTSTSSSSSRTRRGPPGVARSSRPPRWRTPPASSDLPLLEVDRVRDGEGFDALDALEPDAIVVVAYGEILTPDVLDIPRLGAVNVHFSLLPRWRGAAPVQRAILEGDEVTGVTVMLMDEGLDTGPILATVETPIDPEEDAGIARATAGGAGCAAPRRDAARTRRWIRWSRVPRITRPRRTPRSSCPDERTIDWTQPADAIVRRVRAFAPEPGAVTTFRRGRLKVLASRHSVRSAGTCWPTPRRCPARSRIEETTAPVGRWRAPGRRSSSWRSRPAGRKRMSGRGVGARRADPAAASTSDEPERPGGRARGDPPGHRRGRLLEPGPAGGPRTLRPRRAGSGARHRARLRDDPPRSRARRRDRRARRETGRPDDAGRARRAPARRVPGPAHADPGPRGGRGDRGDRRPSRARVRERDPPPARQGAARTAGGAGRSRDQPPDRDDAVGDRGAADAPPARRGRAGRGRIRRARRRSRSA